MISKLRGQMLNMSRHKFASNVCEKALVTADPESRRLLIEEIMSPKQDGVSPIVTMMKDQFASAFTVWQLQVAPISNEAFVDYVLQRALSVAEGDHRELLINKIRPQLTSMRRYSSAYSKHLISSEFVLVAFAPYINGTNHAVERLIEKYSQGLPDNSTPTA
jgi:pumilio RNA-binding family